MKKITFLLLAVLSVAVYLPLSSFKKVPSNIDKTSSLNNDLNANRKGSILTSAFKQQIQQNTVSYGSYPPNNLPITQTLNNGFRLVYQGDGNLVVYSNGPNGRGLWCTNTVISNPGVCIVGPNGIQLRNASNQIYWQVVFPGGWNGLGVILQNDGNFVLYSGTPDFKSIASGTEGGQVSSHWGILK